MLDSETVVSLEQADRVEALALDMMDATVRLVDEWETTGITPTQWDARPDCGGRRCTSSNCFVLDDPREFGRQSLHSIAVHVHRHAVEVVQGTYGDLGPALRFADQWATSILRYATQRVWNRLFSDEGARP